MFKIGDVLTLVGKFVSENYSTDSFFIYGSYAEYYRGYFAEPKDIDVIVIDGSNIEYDTEVHVDIDGISVPVTFRMLSTERIFEDAKSLDPKYFCTVFPVASYAAYSSIDDKLEYAETSTIRSAISHYSSSAYHKGKKKLIVEDDYDEYLGLKNIHHAFKFVMQVIEYYREDEEYDAAPVLKQANIMWYINDIRDLIFSTYADSTGTLEERFKTLDAVIKPLYNKLMTEFRIMFPKGEK